jgi:hypothetical protein
VRGCVQSCTCILMFAQLSIFKCLMTQNFLIHAIESSKNYPRKICHVVSRTVFAIYCVFPHPNPLPRTTPVVSSSFSRGRGSILCACKVLWNIDRDKAGYHVHGDITEHFRGNHLNHFKITVQTTASSLAQLTPLYFSDLRGTKA